MTHSFTSSDWNGQPQFLILVKRVMAKYEYFSCKTFHLPQMNVGNRFPSIYLEIIFSIPNSYIIHFYQTQVKAYSMLNHKHNKTSQVQTPLSCGNVKIS